MREHPLYSVPFHRTPKRVHYLCRPYPHLFVSAYITTRAIDGHWMRPSLLLHGAFSGVNRATFHFRERDPHHPRPSCHPTAAPAWLFTHYLRRFERTIHCTLLLRHHPSSNLRVSYTPGSAFRINHSTILFRTSFQAPGWIQPSRSLLADEQGCAKALFPFGVY